MAIRRIPALSQCMIVKNEEKNIRRALSWGKDIMFEQIVVDTGSTDRTVDIAREMGATVYDFKWIDDFSAAKNFAIDKAKGSWIAFLDADEYVVPEQVPKILPFLRKLENTDYNMVLTNWLQLDDDDMVHSGGTQCRIFRNLPEIRYKRKIHEDLHVKGGERCFADGRETFAIMHKSYFLKENQNDAKSRRNLPIILKELEENPDDYDMMGYLGDAYQSSGEADEAEKWYRKAISLFPDVLNPFDQRSAQTYWTLMYMLMPDSSEKLEEIYKEAHRKLPYDADFDYILGRHYMNKGRYDKAVEHLEQAISIVEEHGNVNRSMLTSGNLKQVWQYLTMCYYKKRDLSACVSSAAAILKEDPYMMGTLRVLLAAFRDEFRKNGEPKTDEAFTFLQRIYDMEKQKDRMFLLRAVLTECYDELAEKLRAEIPAEEVEILEASMKT